MALATKTLNELLDENLEVIKLTRNPSTFRGRRVVIKNFKDAFATIGFTSLDDLNSIIKMAHFTKELGNQIVNEEWGSKYSTNSQRYHTGKAILVEIGVEAPSVAVYLNAKKNVLSNGSTEISIQETINPAQTERLMAILDEVMAGREIKVKGSVVSPRKVAMGNLYLKIAAPYALRQGSIMDLRPSDFTYENLTYRIQKGENKGMPVTRPMNNMTWNAYEQYLTILGHRPEKLFNDASWLSAFVKVVMTEAGVEAHHGRHGIHRFRRALVTWAYNNNKMVEHFSPALDHKNTEVTENDRKFLLEQVNDRLDLNSPLSKDDIIAERSGVRPLVIRRQSKALKNIDWTALSRKHEVEVDHAKQVVSIFGGKLTDCLNVGEEVTAAVETLGIRLNPDRQRWYGEPGPESRRTFFRQTRGMRLDDLRDRTGAEPLSERLWRRYGRRAFEMLDHIREDPSMAEDILGSSDYLRVELHNTASTEMIVHLDDFLRRRSKISLITRQADIQNSKGLSEVGSILFGTGAQTKLDEYFSSNSSPINPTK